MAKRRPARIHGLLLIDKPTGLTSRAVVNKVGWLFNERRCGHAGTLDPEASGVLAIAFGAATKAVGWLMIQPKAYLTTVRFGSSTTTDDADGEVLTQSPLAADISDGEIARAGRRELGQILQVPPQVSALKQNGKRDFQRVRDGETVVRAPRPVDLHEVTMKGRDGDKATFLLTCGSGFYVRAWARDLGLHLHSRAHVSSLRRVSGCGYPVEACHTIDEIEALAPSERDALLVPVSAFLCQLLPHISPSLEICQALRFGQRPLCPDGLQLDSEVFVHEPISHHPVCIARVVESARAEPELVLKVIRGFQPLATNDNFA